MPKPKKKRRGFDSGQFRQIERELGNDSSGDENHCSDPNIIEIHKRKSSIPNNTITESSTDAVREIVYRFVDSIFVSSLISFFLALDFVFSLCFAQYLLHSSNSRVFNVIYYVLDWITALLFCMEVNARLFSYGLAFYFSSALLTLEYVVSMTNAIAIVLFTVTRHRWLLGIRYVRVSRALLSSLRWLTRHLHWRTRSELADLAEMVDDERDSKLNNWKITSSAITVGKRAGAGGYGVVFSGLFRGTIVAIKQLVNPDAVSNNIENEANTLLNLRHPNVILFMGLVKEPGKLWIITEFCSRGSLRDLLDSDESITRARLFKFALGAARGLAYLHGQTPPMLHLDLKTSNILISAGYESKLGDFGLSRAITSVHDPKFSGTLQYSAPEVLKCGEVSTAADIYSFGICMWEMFTKDIPFRGVPVPTLMWGIIDKGWRPPTNRFTTYRRRDFRHRSHRRDAQGKRVMPLTFERIDKLPFLNDELVILHSSSRSARMKSNHAPEGGDIVRRSCSQRLAQRQCSNSEAVGDKGWISRACSDIGAATGMFGRLGSYVSTYNCQKGGRELLEKKSSIDVEDGLVNSPIGRFGSNLASRKQGISAKDNGVEKKGSTDWQAEECIGELDNVNGKMRKGNNLDGLSRKVTAALRMFDDRPPVGRKLDGEGEEMGGRTADGGRGYDALNARGLGAKSSSDKRVGTENGEGWKVERKRSGVGKNVGTKAGGSWHAESGFDKMGGKDGNDVGKSVIYVPEEYVEVMTRCWAEDAEDRPCASELVWRLITLMDEERRSKMD